MRGDVYLSLFFYGMLFEKKHLKNNCKFESARLMNGDTGYVRCKLLMNNLYLSYSDMIKRGYSAL